MEDLLYRSRNAVLAPWPSRDKSGKDSCHGADVLCPEFCFRIRRHDQSLEAVIELLIDGCQ